MKLFAKRALILTIFVLCLFGLTVLAASAEITGVTTQADTHVASVEIEGTTYYYASFNTAMNEAPSGATVTVLKDASIDVVTITDKALTVVGAEKHTLTLQGSNSIAFQLKGTNASLTVSNLVLNAGSTSVNNNAYVLGVKGGTTGTYSLTLNGVATTWKNGSGAIYCYGSDKIDVSLTNCSFAGGTAIINAVAEAKNTTMYLQNVGCVGGVVEVYSGAVVTVTRPAAADYASDAEAVAAGVGFRLGDGEGGALSTKYFMSLNEAITAAQSGDTIYVLANAVFTGGAKISDKTLTIQGANADVVLTHFGGGIQLNGGVVSLTVKNLKINSYANFLDIYTSTDTHRVKLENVTINSKAAASANFMYVSKTKANVEVVNCTVNSTNTIRLMTVGTSGNVTSYAVTNTSLTGANVARVENSGIIGSATSPAVWTDLTANKTVIYAYTGTVYANIFGGTFTGQLVYGGDNHNNVLDIKINPTGDKTTTFTLAAANKYGALVYQNPSDATKNTLGFSFRNTTVVDSGKQSIINGTLTKANVTVAIENSTFGASALAAGGSPKYLFGTDADAKAFGYTVRIVEEGYAPYYKTLTDALKAAPADNGNGGATMIYVIANTTHSAVGANGNLDAKFCKKVHITSAGTTPFTVTGGGASSIAFFTGNGAEITFTNITFQMAGRLARIDGNTTITFGSGAVFNHTDAIFIYDNGNSYVEGAETDKDTTDDVYVSDLNYTIDIQKGAVINSTGSLSIGLIYRSVGALKNGETTITPVITVKISGTISMTADKPIVYDNDNAKTFVYYDASSASVTHPGSVWFNQGHAQYSMVYVKGFATTAEADAWGYAHVGTVGARTLNLTPGVEWAISFAGTTQFVSAMHAHLGENTGASAEIMVFGELSGGVYATMSFKSGGTITVKAYNSSAYIRSQDVSFRYQIYAGTNFVLDGIRMETPGAAVQLNAGTGAKPATFSLINGASLVATVTSAANPIKIVGGDAHVYVDATSSITQSGTTTGASSLIYASSAWKYGSIVIEGTISSSVTGNTECALIKVDSTETSVVVSVNINNLVDENGASTLGSVTPFLFKSGATPNLGLCTNDEAKVALIKNYTVSINGVAQPAFDATKTVRGDFQHYYNTLAGGMLGVDNGGTVTVLKDIALSASSHYIEYKSFTIQGLTGSEELTMAGQMVDGVPVKVNKHMFNISNNAHVTFKHIYITADRFVVFRAAGEDSVLTVTLGEGAHVTNVDLATDNDILIYGANNLLDSSGNVVKDSAGKEYGAGNIVINIEAGASLITKSLSSVSPSYGSIAIHQAASVTLNVWGTLKNIAITPDGKNAQVFVAKGKYNNATLNIYDGAVIEGTSDSESYSGNYSGIIYFSEGYSGGNAINMYGGTVTIHGNTGFAYVGVGCVINISGGTIDNRDGKYALFFGSSPVATISGTDEKKPTFYVNAKLLNSGTLNNAVNAFDESGYAVAATLGFAVIYLEDNNTAYTTFDAAWAAIPDGGTATLQLLVKVTLSTLTVDNKHVTFIGRDGVVTDITYTDHTNADLYLSCTSGYALMMKNSATLTFKNMALFANRPLFQSLAIDRDDIAAEDQNITLSFINSWASGGNWSSVFMNLGGAYNAITVNVDADSRLLFGPGSASDSTMFSVATGASTKVTLNLDGTLDMADRFVKSKETDPEYRNSRIIYAPATIPITLNVSESASILFSCNETQAKADHSIIQTASGSNVYATIAVEALLDENGVSTLGDMYLYFANASGVPDLCITAPDTTCEGTLTAFKAKISAEQTPIALRAEDENGYRYYAIQAAINSVEAGGEGSFRVLQTVVVSSEVVISGKDITLIGADITGYHIDSTAGYAFCIDNLGALTFRDMKITATQGLIRYRGVSSSIAQADRDVYINFENTLVDAEGAATSLISSDANHNNDATKKCDSVTLTIDKDSEINFTTSATGDIKPIRYDHNTHTTVLTYIHGTVNVTVTGDSETAYFYFVRSNNPSTTQITVSKTAHVNITLPAGRVASGHSYFTSSTGGNLNSNKVYLHADAITKNGALTLGGVELYTAYFTSSCFEVMITASDTSMDAAFAALHASKGNSTSGVVAFYPILYRVMVENTYYYVSEWSTALAKFAERGTGLGGLHFFADTAISPKLTFSKGTVIVSAADGVTLTKAGEISGSTYNAVTDYLFNIGSNTNVIFKNVTVKSVRIIEITANEANATVTITLDEGTLFEGLPNKAAHSGDAALIYKSSSNVDVTINVKAGATMLVPATETVNNPLVYLSNGAKGTVNVWGTMKNLASVAAGSAAQIFIAKNSCNAFLNVYDGAVIEGTSDSVTYSGNYAGIVYYSAATLNGINVEGGTITIHGRSGFAYTGTKCNITISGGTINNTEAEYAMLFGGSQTATITGTDTVKPTINTSKKLLNSGTAYAVNAFTDEGYKTVAKTLGFVVLLDASKTACNTWNSTMVTKLSTEDTLYLLQNFTLTTAIATGTDLVGKKLTVTGYGDTKYTMSTSLSSAYIPVYLGKDSHFVVDNVVMELGCRFLRFDDTHEGGYMKLDFTENAEVYALPGGDGNFIYYSGNHVLTINIEEGAVIQRKGDSSGSYGYLFNLGETFAAGSVINVKGKISDTTVYTGADTRSSLIFNVPDADITVNIYPTAVFENALTKSQDAAKLSVTRYNAGGFTYFKNFETGTDYDAMARGYGVCVRTKETPDDSTAYTKNLNLAVSKIETGATATVYVIGAVSVNSEVKIVDKNITVIGLVFDGDYHLNVTARAFAIYSKGTLTLKDLRIRATAQLVDYNANEKVAGEKANKDVVINFQNTDVTVTGNATTLVSSRNHYATDKGGCGEQGDSATVNIDADSSISFTSAYTSAATAESGIYFIAFNHNSHPYVYANIDGSITIDSTGETLGQFHFIHSNNPNLTHVNVSDTARISISLKADCASAYLVTYSTGGTANHLINLAAEAVVNEEGGLTVGDVKLYLASAAHIPQVCITASTDWAQEALKEWAAMEAGENTTPIQYRVDFAGKLHYYNIYDLAKAAADANGTVVIYVNASTLPNVEAAIQAGAIFRLGDATDAGVLGVNYFTNLDELMGYVGSQGMTEIVVWVLTESSDNSQITLTGIKMIIDSVDSTKQTLKLGASPAFKLDADSQLVVKNVKIEVTNAFVQIVNTDTTKYTKLDLEDGAYVDLKAATSDGKRYFLLLGSGSAGNTGILTVNVKQGAKINATADASGGTHGLFQISTSRKNTAVAADSSINVNGEINFSQNYTANGFAPIFMVNNPNLVININDGATLTMAHTGKTTTSVWHAIFCLDGGSTTVNVGNATLKANANGSLFGINGPSTGAVLTVTGATFTAENFPMGVIDGYTANTTSNNSQKATFQNCTFTGSVASHSRMTGITLINATFNSVEHAKANFGVLRLGDSATTGYYSDLAGAIASTPDGGTLWVVGNVSGFGATITDKSLTVQGISATDRPVITNNSDGSARIFSCYGDVNLTLKDLEINAKARAVTFQLIAKEWDEEGKPTAYYDNTSSSLRILNTDIYGFASGANHNDMIGLGDGKGHHYFDLYIDADSSVGYLDGNAADIRSSRDYQVIFYYASVTGDIVIEGDVFAHVYFCGDQVDYEKVANSWTVYGPNAQHMILIGNGSTHQFVGDIIIKGNLTHKVVFPETDQNGNRVYPEDYPSRHSAYAIYVNGTTAGVFVADGATFTIDYQNAYQPRCKAIGFDGYASDYNTTCDNGATAGRYHYWGAGALLAFLNNNAYASNRITVATDTGSNYGIVYDNTTFYSETKNSDGTTTYAYGYDYKGAKEIAELISTLTGASVTHTKDTTTFGKEIIVGIANRDIVQTYLPQLEMNEYAIIIDGNYILILAWNNAALNVGVASFKHALNACAVNGKVYLPNISGALTFVANDNWNNDFAKPEGTLWGGQYVNDNSLQYVYNGYSSTQAGHQAFMNYCNTLVAQGYTLVWQNVIENNLFRLYRNVQNGHALYVAYNDYAYKDEYYGTNGDDGLYGQEENDKTEIPSSGNLNDEYFENRDHRKVIRVVSMPLASVKMPDNGILVQDMSYEKVTNTLQTTLSFRGSSVGLGHVYMLEDGSFLVIDGGGTGNTLEDDRTEIEAIYDVLVKMYTDVYGHAPTEEKPIHIKAWYLTHPHWDHISAFTNFMKAHGAELTMDYAIANVPVQESAYWNAELSITHSTIKNTLNYAKGGKKTLIRPQTGQKLYLANLEIEVLMTYEDHAPFDIINSNDTNTVTRFRIHNQDAMNGVTAEVLYLGDSWRHSSRILCEMYGDYLQTEIVQLAHHGNIGCERVLYKTIAPRAVYFPHDSGLDSNDNKIGFWSYVYFNSFSSANAAQENAFRYAADVWCATNAEYVWSAPYGTYNVLEFLPARPDYENIKDLFTGTLLTSGNQYDTSYSRWNSSSSRKHYIHNTSKGYKSVNIVWGDLSFTYEGSAGVWSPETLRYEGAEDGRWVPNGNNYIWVGNASTGNDTTVNVQLSFAPANGYSNFTGSFTHNGQAVAANTNIALATKEYKEFEFILDTTTLPENDLENVIVGSVTVTLK